MENKTELIKGKLIPNQDAQRFSISWVKVSLFTGLHVIKTYYIQMCIVFSFYDM